MDSAPKMYKNQNRKQSHFSVFFGVGRGGFCQNRVKIVVASTILFGFCALSANFATPVSAASLTLTVPDAINLDLSPDMNSGFKESDSATAYAQTSGFWGYNFTIKATENNTLKNGSSIIDSITQSLSSTDFSSKVAANTWGYKPPKVNGTTNTNYLAGPTTSETVIEKTSAANTSTNPYNFSIAAKVDATLPTGTYKNTFILTLSANTVSYNITYHLNSGSWSGTSPQTGSSAEQKITLDSHTPSRNGYTFQGWCSTSTANDTCSNGGQTYSPGAEYTLVNGNNMLDLYAMWKSAKPTTMQEFGDYCDSMKENEDITLQDTRDNNSYVVTKLKDGQCWMTQNLRIIGRSISSSDSDMTSGSYTIPNDQPSAFSTSSDNQNSNHAYYGGNTSYGAHYTWYSATAGSGNSSLTTANAVAPNSICPKGWKLPTGGAGGNFKNIATLYNISSNSTGSNILRNEPLNFIYAGCILYSNGELYAQSSEGHYWSSTVYDSNHAYYLRFRNSDAYPQIDNYRPYGFSVRCIAR